jgi:hypothetical protein
MEAQTNLQAVGEDHIVLNHQNSHGAAPRSVEFRVGRLP